MSYAMRVSRTAPRILNWEAKSTSGFKTLRKYIFKKRSITTFQTLKPTYEELHLPYVTGLEEASISNAPQFESYDKCAINNDEDDEYPDKDEIDDIDHSEQPESKVKKCSYKAKIQEKQSIRRSSSDSE
ncbi:hypothetical protein ACOSQ3_023057 [Xanthoceras sorbifolium]